MPEIRRHMHDVGNENIAITLMIGPLVARSSSNRVARLHT